MFKPDPRFKQGVFSPRNKEKYRGNSQPIYRSSYELKFMLWCDRNSNVIEWGSENVIIPYVSPLDNRVHRYYVDNYVCIKEGDVVIKYLIEIKPSTQTVQPQLKKGQHKKTFEKNTIVWLKNKAKWESAQKFCEQKGYKWLLLTEKELGIK